MPERTSEGARHGNRAARTHVVRSRSARISRESAHTYTHTCTVLVPVTAPCSFGHEERRRRRESCCSSSSGNGERRNERREHFLQRTGVELLAKQCQCKSECRAASHRHRQRVCERTVAGEQTQHSSLCGRSNRYASRLSLLGASGCSGSVAAATVLRAMKALRR